MQARILSAIGTIQDRLTQIEDRIKAIEVSQEKATKEEVVLIRESLIEVRAELIREGVLKWLRKEPVPLPPPPSFHTTLEDF